MSENPRRPSTDDRAAWKAYWRAHGMPWRTEPEVDEERQLDLAQRRALPPDVGQGMYPFKGIKLTRGDVEWLLATHESGGIQGPVDWDLVEQRKRVGLDLRAADLRGIDLSHLPLARLQGGLTEDDFQDATLEQRTAAAVQLDGAILAFAHLEGSALTYAQLRGIDGRSAHLEGADLYHAHFEASVPSNLRRASFDSQTVLNHAVLANASAVGPFLGNIRWNGVILTSIDWLSVNRLGEDDEGLQRSATNDVGGRLGRLPAAVTANRQLAVELRAQGLSEAGDHFAYRAQVLQRQVLRRQGHWLRALGSLLLDLMSGYGYRPLRAFLTYVLVIVAFAGLYFLNAQSVASHLTWDESLVLSISSFHGRGFFSSDIHLGDGLARLAAGEAIIGLFIEITFIGAIRSRETAGRRWRMRGIPQGMTTGWALAGANSCPSW
jgi:hypothetical protein